MSLPKFNNLSFKKIGLDLSKTKQRPNSLTGKLLAAIDKSDFDGVSSLAPQISKPSSDSRLIKIAEAVVEGGFTFDIAQKLDEHNLLSYGHVLDAMIKYESWQGLTWMARSPQSIERINESGRKPYIWQNISGTDENLDILASLDLERLLSETMDGKYAQAHPCTYILGRISPKTNSPEVVGRFIEAVTDIKVFNAAKTSDIDPDSIWWRRASVIEFALANCLDEEKPEGFAWFEDMLRSTPGLHEIWNDYWKTIPGETSNKLYQNVRGTRVKNVREVEEFPDGPGKAPPPEDFPELLVRINPSWLPDVLVQGGEAAEIILQTIENNNNLYWFLNGLKSKSLSFLMPVLERRFGEWRDEKGRGLGHAIAIAGPGETQTPIRSLLASERGRKLLTEPDHSGKSAMTFLASGKQWENHKVFISHTTRKLLAEHAEKVKLEKVKKERPAM